MKFCQFSKFVFEIFLIFISIDLLFTFLCFDFDFDFDFDFFAPICWRLFRGCRLQTVAVFQLYMIFMSENVGKCFRTKAENSFGISATCHEAY